MQPGAIGRPLLMGTQATVQPALTLDFTGATLPSLSFVRGSTATFIGSTGLIQAAAAGVPRQNRDPQTLTCKGLLIERQATNLITSSSSPPVGVFNNVGTPGATTGPDGVAGSAWVFPSSQTGFMQSNYSVSGLPSVCTFSVFAKKTGVGARVYLGLTQVTTAYVAVGGYYDFASDSFVNCPAGCYSVPHANGWRRLIYPVSGVTSGASSFVWRLDAGGTYGGDMRGIAFWGAQLEAGADATSIIPTAGSTQTRAADVASVSVSGLSLATGAVSIGLRANTAATEASNRCGLALTGATSSIYALNWYRTAVTGGEDGPYLPSAAKAGLPAITDTALHKVAMSWDCSAGWGGVSADGAAASVGTQAAVTPLALTTLYLGADRSASAGNMTIASVAVYSRRLPVSVLQRMTR